LDLQFDQLPVLYVLGDRFCQKTFKGNVLPSLRNMFNNIMEEIGNNHNNLTAWKKFFILPYIFFTTKLPSIQKQYVKLLQTEEGWASLSIRMLLESHRPRFFQDEVPTQQNMAEETESTDDNPSKIHRLVFNLSKNAQLSKATQRLCTKSVSLLDNSVQNVTNLLLAKHPDYGDRAGVAATIMENVNNKVKSISYVEKVTDADVFDLVADCDDNITPGVDRFMVDHLKLFMGTSVSRKQGSQHNDAQEVKFCTLYTMMINLLLTARVPKDVSRFLAINLLLALPKSE
jgi:hypothetical protein